MKPEVKHLSDSGWIKRSLVVDSGAAESAAQVGRECGFHRTCTTPPAGGRPQECT